MHEKKSLKLAKLNLAGKFSQSKFMKYTVFKNVAVLEAICRNLLVPQGWGGKIA